MIYIQTPTHMLEMSGLTVHSSMDLKLLKFEAAPYHTIDWANAKEVSRETFMAKHREVVDHQKEVNAKFWE